MKGKREAPLLPLVKGELLPIAWGVKCPNCGGMIEIDCVEEDDAGIFYATDADTAPECEVCGVVVESDGVALHADPSPPYRSRRF